MTNSSENENLKSCIVGARQQLNHVENPSEASEIAENMANRGYIFEGHLTVDPKPPRPQWLVQFNLLIATATLSNLEISQWSYKNNNITSENVASILLQQWKTMSVSLRSWSIHSFSDSVSDYTFESIRRTPSEFLVVYVGTDRRRSVIPTRLLNLLIFVALLNKVEEEFRLHSGGGLVFPCEVGFFKEIPRFFWRRMR